MQRRRVSCHHILNSERGFTLIETAIALVILSLLLIPLIGLYSSYQVDRKAKITATNLASAVRSLEDFKDANGRYPCPASLSANRPSANYGVETSCTDTSVSTGSCAAGMAYCVQESPRATLANRRVRIGALPFRALAMTEGETYDAHGSRLLYVMTESLGDVTTFSDTNGGIRLVDSNNKNLSDPEDSVKMLVLTVGKNKIGGFSMDGVQSSSCSAASGLDRENCDFALGTNQAIFLSGMTSDGENTSSFDDIVKFFETGFGTAAGGWRAGVAGLLGTDGVAENANDITLPSRDVRVGNLRDNPTETLDISGSLLLDDTATGEIQADEVCDPNDANCFAVSQLIHTCGPGEYVAGIAQLGGNTTKIICNALLFGCPDGQILRGKNPDGTPSCVAAPPATRNDRCLPADNPRCCVGFDCGRGAVGDGDGDGDIDNPTDPTCRVRTEISSAACTNGSPNSYQQTRTFDCLTNSWVSMGDTSWVDCCTLPPENIVTNNDCGPYGSGSVQYRETIVPGTCSYGNRTYLSVNCTCDAPDREFYGHSDCGAGQSFGRCASQLFSYSKDGNGLCTIRAPQAGSYDGGTCQAATRTLVPQGTATFSTRRVGNAVGSSCSAGGICWTTSGSGFAIYNCTCSSSSGSCRASWP